MTIQNPIKPQLLSVIPNTACQIAAVSNRAIYLWLRRGHGFLCPRGRRPSRSSSGSIVIRASPSRRRRTSALFHFLKAQHALHLRHCELVHGVVAEGLTERVVGPNIISLFGQRAPFLHEHLRRVKDRPLIVQSIIHIRWIGSQRQREFLSGLLPLLVLLSLHAAIVVIFSLLSDGAHRDGEQARDDDKR